MMTRVTVPPEVTVSVPVLMPFRVQVDFDGSPLQIALASNDTLPENPPACGTMTTVNVADWPAVTVAEALAVPVFASVVVSL